MFLRRAIAVSIVTAIVAPGAAVADPVTDPKRTFVPDGEVKAFAVSGSTVFVGGNFSRIAPYTGSSARFDSTSAALKSWPEVDGVVNDVVADGSGGWYLGGNFRSVGGQPRTDLAHVMPDGTLDPGFAPTTNGEVRALAVGAGGVFAGGEFSQANGTARGNLAAFFPNGDLSGFVGNVDGTGPHTLFDPLGVHALLLKGSKLYVGGEFNRANGAVRLRGAAFAVGNSALDSSWQPNPNRLINGIALDSDGTDLFIGGRFSEVDGSTLAANTPRNGVAKVNESNGLADPNWLAAIGSGTDLKTLMVFGSQVYLAGTVNVLSPPNWPAASFSTVNNNAGIDNNWHPLPLGSVQSLAAAGSTVYLGSGSIADGLPQPAIMGIDKDTFNPGSSTPTFAPPLGRGRLQLPSGQEIGVRAIAVNGSDVVAGGTFTTAGGVDRRNLAAIDLNTGEPTAFNPPMKGTISGLTSVTALALTSDGLVWAGGDFITEGPNPRAQLAAFDRTTGAIASFHRDPSGGVLEGVTSLAASGSTVYVGGTFTHVGGAAFPRRNVAAVRHVPGEDGTVLPFDPDVDGAVRALAVDGDKVYLGGQFSTVNGSIASLKRDRRNIAVVDATTGLDTGLDPDADNVVRSLHVAEGNLYAGGDFLNVGHGIPRQRLAAFSTLTGATRDWNPGADGPVRALATYGPTVFAAGDFANAGGAARSGVADFDIATGAPDSFSPVLDTEERGGPSPPVTRVGALHASVNGLLTGGTFVMNSPTPRTANLGVFGLEPLVLNGPGGGGGPGPSGGGQVTPGDGLAPALSAFSASAKRFRVAPGATAPDGTATAAAAKKKKKPPRGTTLTLQLSEAARVKFEVLAKGRGRKVGKRCVKQTRKNRKRKRCTLLTLKKPAFTRSAPAGRSKVKWSGRLGRKALKPGSYQLRATATDAAGNTGKARTLNFTIVR